MKPAVKIMGIVTVLWMAFIFFMSGQTAEDSSSLSNVITRFIVDILEPGEHLDEELPAAVPADSTVDLTETPEVPGEQKTNERTEPLFGGGNSPDYDPIPNRKWWGIPPYAFKNFIRKSAHFSVFMFLGVFASITLFLGFRRKRWAAPTALVFCVLYAMTDEFHQIFVEGRGAEFSDVCLDSMGALIGILLVSLIYAVVCAVKKFRRTAP